MLMAKFYDFQERYNYARKTNPWDFRKDKVLTGRRSRAHKPKQPFLGLYKIMPFESEIERYQRLMKVSGFTS